jgi:hypothetical protein
MTIRLPRLGDPAVRRGRVEGAEAEQRLEGGLRRASSVLAEQELVEVHLQVLGRDAAVGALEPRLEVGDGAVSAREDELPVEVTGPLLVHVVVEAPGARPRVAEPAVGMHARAKHDAGGGEAAERGPRGVGDHPQAQPPGAGSADLDGDGDERLAVALAPAAPPRVAAADDALVDLDGPSKRLALGRPSLGAACAG